MDRNDSSPDMVRRVLETAARNIDVVRRRAGRPLTLADKLLLGHADNPRTVGLTPGESQLSLRADRVVFQDVLGQTGMLQFMQTGRDKVAIPTTIHCDHLITAKDGTVTGVSRSLPGVSGEGIRLRAGRKYRITAVYNNTTGKVLHNGAMAHITGIFAPDKPSEWPAINESDPEYQKDLASLEEMGQGDDMEGMEHMDHNAEPPHEHNH